MLAQTASLVLQGITPIKIEIEVNGHQGVPGLILIGLPAKAVDEAKERITSTLHSCKIRIRGKRTVVNLAPADLRKTSSALDLPIVIGLLAMYGEISQPSLSTAFLGELALDGRLKPLTNASALIIGALQLGFKKIILPATTQLPQVPFEGIEIIQVNSLTHYLDWHRGKVDVAPFENKSPSSVVQTNFPLDHILGQITAKRALQISAAGGHHLLFTGSPGVGKTLLAQALPSLLPPLTNNESLEVMAIHSLCHERSQSHGQRPFRCPHHSITTTGLIGGTAQFRPGEITLAHCGVLCLDELPEFNQHVLESLRQPLEQKRITITNSQGSTTFPCDFILVGTANPCPCGFAGSATKVCRCSLESKIRYHQKLSGPLIDRIDLLHTVDPWVNESVKTDLSMTTKTLQRKINSCREIQIDRYKPLGYSLVTQIPREQLMSTLNLTSEGQHLATKACQKLLLSVRAHTKMLRVAQTIADLESCSMIDEGHVAEALQYRKPDELHQRLN